MIELKNEKLTVLVNEKGAELTSVKNTAGREYIWGADPKFWAKHCPVLFPVCGRLLDMQYTHEGKTYKMGNHGFGQHKVYKAQKLSDTEALFTLHEDEETLAMYPFRFLFSVHYKLDGDAPTITYRAENPDEKPLYFNFGSHEAYATDGNFEDWSVEFERTENLAIKETPVLGYLSDNVIPFRENVKELPLSHKLFENDSLLFDGLKSRRVTLKHNGRPVVEVRFAGFDHLLLWTKVGAPYLCIEPWNGLPDYVYASGELSAKKGILRLNKGRSIAMPHTIRFL